MPRPYNLFSKPELAAKLLSAARHVAQAGPSIRHVFVGIITAGQLVIFTAPVDKPLLTVFSRQ